MSTFKIVSNPLFTGTPKFEDKQKFIDALNIHEIIEQKITEQMIGNMNKKVTECVDKRVNELSQKLTIFPQNIIDDIMLIGTLKKSIDSLNTLTGDLGQKLDKTRQDIDNKLQKIGIQVQASKDEIKSNSSHTDSLRQSFEQVDNTINEFKASNQKMIGVLVKHIKRIDETLKYHIGEEPRE